MVSRETMVMDLCSEEDRVQYDAQDEQRIAGMAALFTNISIMMIEALHQYSECLKAVVDENSADKMKGARADIVMAWGALQAATSKIAGMLRIDGDTAFERVLAVANSNEDPDVAGL